MLVGLVEHSRRVLLLFIGLLIGLVIIAASDHGIRVSIIHGLELHERVVQHLDHLTHRHRVELVIGTVVKGERGNEQVADFLALHLVSHLEI